jgi:sugar-specific transcriptional regulator TrmB
VARILNHLKGLGLTEYEGKAYLTLLKESPSTAYELGRNSGIPTSKIYHVLEKLSGKGIVSVVDDGKIKRYIPMNPDDLLHNHKTMTERIVHSLGKDLNRIHQRLEFPSMWNITEYDHLVEKVKDMTKAAKKTMLLSIWNDEFELIEENIRGAVQRGVKTVVLHFGQSKSRVCQIYQHPIEGTVYLEKGGRSIIASIDSAEMLMGTIFKYGRIHGVWSKNRGFAIMAEDYIKHDIYMMKIIRRFDRSLQEKFGIRYEKLRDVFRDEDIG